MCRLETNFAFSIAAGNCTLAMTADERAYVCDITVTIQFRLEENSSFACLAQTTNEFTSTNLPINLPTPASQTNLYDNFILI